MKTLCITNSVGAIAVWCRIESNSRMNAEWPSWLPLEQEVLHLGLSERSQPWSYTWFLLLLFSHCEHPPPTQRHTLRNPPILEGYKYSKNAHYLTHTKKNNNTQIHTDTYHFTKHKHQYAITKKEDCWAVSQYTPSDGRIVSTSTIYKAVYLHIFMMFNK